MTPNTRALRSTQRGATLVELVLALALMSVLVIGIAQTMSGDRKSLALATVASRITEVRTAADRYIRDNFTALDAATAAGPIAIDLATLQNGAYLPANFSDVNSYRQSLRVYVRRRAPGVLESLVAAVGGQAMTAAEGGQVAQLLKGPGGFASGGVAKGTKGGWTVDLASFVPSGQPMPSGGAVAYVLARKVDGPTGALMRDATGNPADNRMSTDLDMNNNRIINIRDLQVGGQTINNTTISNINDLAAVSCSYGEALTKMGSTFMCTPMSAMPGGGIAAFLTACPAGWASVPEFAGRVLVASGNGYNAGDKGGSDSVVLTEAQMPAHSHGNGLYDDGSGFNRFWRGRQAVPWVGGSAIQDGKGPDGGTYEGVTETKGGNQAFDNRQAYYAVNYCRKQ